MTDERRIAVEPRNLLWPNATAEPLLSLRISDVAGHVYVDLYEPSVELACAALWEAVTRYARVWHDNYAAPPLQIMARTVPR